MVNIDIKSVLYFIILNNVFIIFLFAYFVLYKKLRQWFLNYYLIGFLFQTLALVGIILRKQLPPEISIHGSHLLLNGWVCLANFFYPQLRFQIPHNYFLAFWGGCVSFWRFDFDFCQQ